MNIEEGRSMRGRKGKGGKRRYRKFVLIEVILSRRRKNCEKFVGLKQRYYGTNFFKCQKKTKKNCE
jgi:hypothetical protein